MHVPHRLFTFVFFLTAVCLAVPSWPAIAHTGDAAAFGFISGFAHPFGGSDHLLAMAAIGLWAAQLGGTATVLLPTAFVFSMLVGAAAAGTAVSLAEHLIALSVPAAALPVAFAVRVPTPHAMAYAGLLAFFHGHVHGSELPAGADATSYFVGFAAATLLIHVGGVAVGLVGRARAKPGFSTRLAGKAIVAAGSMLIVV